MKSKKVKTNVQQSPKETRKARRSIPQHRRGTHIQPSQDAMVEKEPFKTKVKPADLPPPDSPNELDEAIEVSRTESHDRTNNKSSDTARERVGHETQNAKEVKVKKARTRNTEKDVVQEDGAVVNPVGKPGPRKRKKSTKPAEHTFQQEVELEAEPEQQEALPVPKDGLVVNSIGKRGPRRGRKSANEVSGATQREPLPNTLPEDRQPSPSAHSTPESSAPSQAFADEPPANEKGQTILTGDLRKKYQKLLENFMQDLKLEGTKIHEPGFQLHLWRYGFDDPRIKWAAEAKARKEEEGARKSQLKDETKEESMKGARVNPIGRPGPPRRKKQNRQPVEPAHQVTAGAEDPHRKVPAKTHSNNAATTQPQNGHSNNNHSSFQPINAPAPPADRIPTPPESPEAVQPQHGDDVDDGDEEEENYDHRTSNFVDATNQVSEWLNSQKTPAPPDLPPSAKRSLVQVKKAPKRKSVSKEYRDDNDEYSDEEESEVGAGSEYLSLERGVVKGAWSDEEKAIADRVFQSACRGYQVDEYTLKCWIIDWTNVGFFKDDIYEAFPFRSFAAIRKFCKRRYHPHQTGPWTAEQDHLLRENYALYPDKWEVICEVVRRSAGDCRTRWRDVLEFEGTMEKGPWSQEEEKRLVKVVGECLRVIKRESKDPEVLADPEKMESLISWKEVAQKNGRTRTAKRCSEKWRKLKTTDPALMKGQARATTAAAPSSKAQEYNKQSRKQQAVEKLYGQLGLADVWDALHEIVNVMRDDPDKQFKHESTFWSMVATRLPNSKFSSALRRRAYYGALEDLGNLVKVAETEGMARKVMRASDCMYDLAKKEGFRYWRREYKVGEKVVGSEDAPAPEESQAQGGAEGEVNEIPETQEQQAEEDEHEHEDGDEELEVVDDLDVSSTNSRYERSLGSGNLPRARLKAEDFMARCRAAGRRQHRAFVRAGA